MTTLNSLESLVSDLKALNNVHATIQYSPSAWVEIIVEDRLLGPEVLRRIADHDCGIADLATVDSRVLVVRIEETNQ